MTRTRNLALTLAVLALTLAALVGLDRQPGDSWADTLTDLVTVDAADATPAEWDDGDNTGTAWNICLWVGARDIGTSYVYLRRAYNVDWYGDAWVACHYEIRRPTGSLSDRSCAYNITDRDRADSVLGTYWSFGPYDFNGCRN